MVNILGEQVVWKWFMLLALLKQLHYFAEIINHVKTFQIFLPIIFFFTSDLCYSQSFKELNVKTIFELLEVKDESKPLVFQPSEDQIYVSEDGGMKYNSQFITDSIGFKNLFIKIQQHISKNSGKDFNVGQLIDFYEYGRKYCWKLLYKNGQFELLNDDNKILTRDSFFYMVGSNGGFNIINDKPGSRFYNPEGNLIFDHKFEFVETASDGYYTFSKNKKTGISDSKGKIILQAEFDEAHAFNFKNKTWYILKDGDKQYFRERLSPKPLMTTDIFYAPYIKGNCWVIHGKVYDIVNQKQLFCNIDQEIDFGRKANVFRIEKYNKFPETEKIYFDVKGKLLLDYPISSEEYVNDTLRIAKIWLKDTIVEGESYPISRYGLYSTTTYKWILIPDYYYMVKVGPIDKHGYIAYWNNKEKKMHLMDPAFKEHLSEGKWNHFYYGGAKDKILCANDSASFIFDLASKKFHPLEKQFLGIMDFTMPNGMMRAYLGSNKHNLLNRDYKIAYPGVYSDIRFAQNGLYEFYFFKDEERDFYGEKLFLNRNLQEMKVNYNGMVYDRFINIDSIGENCYFYKIKNNLKLIETSPGKYLEVKYEYVTYDPFFDWYISRTNEGSGIIDKEGEVILPFMFSRIKPFEVLTGTMQLEAGEEHIQQLNAEGKIVFNGIYDKVEVLVRDYYIVTENGLKGVLNKSGEPIIPIKYKYLKVDRGKIWYGDTENNLAIKDIYSIFKK